MKDEGLDDDGIEVEVEVAEPEEEVGLQEEENEELLQEENDGGEMMMMMEDTAATPTDDVPLTVPNGDVTMSNNVHNLPSYACLPTCGDVVLGSFHGGVCGFCVWERGR